MRRVFFLVCTIVLLCSISFAFANSNNIEYQIIPHERVVKVRPLESYTLDLEIYAPSVIKQNITIECENKDSTICDAYLDHSNQTTSLRITGKKEGITFLTLYLYRNKNKIENTKTIVTVKVEDVIKDQERNNVSIRSGDYEKTSAQEPVRLDSIVLTDYSLDELVKLLDRIQAYLEIVAPDKAVIGSSTTAITVSEPTPKPKQKSEGKSGNANQISTVKVINRYGKINRKVNFRSGPGVNTPLAGDPLNSGSYVYMIENEVNASGEVWTKVIARHKEGYVKSEYITALNDSDNERVSKSYSNSSSNNTTKAKNTAKETDARGKTYSNSKGVALTVLDVKQTKGDDFFEAEDGNVFVLVELQIENKSSNDIYINTTFGGFDAICDDYMVGISYMAEFVSPNRLSSRELKSGKKVKGWKGIEVPKNWKEIVFTFTPMKPTGALYSVGEPIEVYIYNK